MDEEFFVSSFFFNNSHLLRYLSSDISFEEKSQLKSFIFSSLLLNTEEKVVRFVKSSDSDI